MSDSTQRNRATGKPHGKPQRRPKASALPSGSANAVTPIFRKPWRQSCQSAAHAGVRFDRAISNLVLIPIFTLALILMSAHGYNVTSVFKLGSTSDIKDQGQTVQVIEEE